MTDKKQVDGEAVLSSDQLGAGTDLYRRALAYDYGDKERSELMAEVWSGTPWMVDAFTGHTNDDREREIRLWCREQFGPEAWPIHGHAGQWHRGSATVMGWTWIGFATKEQMEQFEQRWPAPNAAVNGTLRRRY